MATQRLALNLQRSLRSRQALNAIKSPLRRYANPVTPSRTESTTLSNGLTVTSLGPAPELDNADGN